jgi:hypothetical protein
MFPIMKWLYEHVAMNVFKSCKSDNYRDVKSPFKSQYAACNLILTTECDDARQPEYAPVARSVSVCREVVR